MINSRENQHDEAALEIIDFSIQQSFSNASMQEKNNMRWTRNICAEPDRIMFGIAIACCMTTDISILRAVDYFNLFDKNFKPGRSLKFIKEEEHVFAAIIIACDRFGERVKVLQYYWEMVSICPMRPSAAVTNAALRAAAFSKDWQQFERIESSLAIFGRTQMESPLTQTPRPLPTMIECRFALETARNGHDINSAVFKVSGRSSGSDEDRISLIDGLIISLNNQNLECDEKLRRKLKKLIRDLKEYGCVASDLTAISPTLQVYLTLIQAAGFRKV